MSQHDDLKRRARAVVEADRQWRQDWQTIMGRAPSQDEQAEVIEDLLTALEAAEATRKLDEEAMRGAVPALKSADGAIKFLRRHDPDFQDSGILTAAIATLTARLNPESNMQAGVPPEGGPVLRFYYRNHRGEVAERCVMPDRVWFGKTEWHPREQWFLSAWDTVKGAHRDFAIHDILSHDQMEAWRLASLPPADEVLVPRAALRLKMIYQSPRGREGCHWCQDEWALGDPETHKPTCPLKTGGR